jgi:salicylate hydroxylase
MTHWSVGRVTLLGDACYAMLPFMAQGAAQAIEDGVTVTGCLSQISTDTIPEAFRRYEGLRLARTARIQGLAAANKTRLHLPDGPAQQARDAKMAQGGTDFSMEAVTWLYGFDAANLEGNPVGN